MIALALFQIKWNSCEISSLL